jgi:hypothetical protein
MKSNGFGSWEQRIIFHVDKEHEDQVATRLGIRPFKEAGEPVRTYFEWTRLTARPGNDEDVVWDLSMELGIGDVIDWKIDWDASDY